METSNQLSGVLAERSRSMTVGRRKLASVRMSPGGYLALGAILTFAALVCLRTQRDLLALILVSATWILVPLLVLTDRLSFDGVTLKRSGFGTLPRRIFQRNTAENRGCRYRKNRSNQPPHVTPGRQRSLSLSRGNLRQRVIGVVCFRRTAVPANGPGALATNRGTQTRCPRL